MTALTYYVAASLDGFIATPDGGIDWLTVAESEGEDYGYADFFAGIDALVLGRITYEQILGFGEWPYADKPCWVMARQTLPSSRTDVIVTDQHPSAVVQAIAERGHRRIWLVGGGTLAGAFQAAGLITDVIVSVIPIVLGNGIPLFGASGIWQQLQLVETTPYPSGVVQLHYRPKEAPAC